MAPAGQTNVLADITFAKRAAGMGPVTMHGNPGKEAAKIGIEG
jgi:hypothetical protein